MRHVSAKDQAVQSGKDDEDDEETATVDTESEMIKRQVQKDMQARFKAGRRKTRNNAKLSVKGKLVHKDQW